MILVADDEADRIYYYILALRDAGLDVEVVPDCASVLERLRTNSTVDLVVLDAFLPAGDGNSDLGENGGAHGVPLCLQLRKTWPNLRIVFLTAMASTEFLETIPNDVPIFSKAGSDPFEFASEIKKLLKR